jgi:hypothetical protein
VSQGKDEYSWMDDKDSIWQVGKAGAEWCVGVTPLHHAPPFVLRVPRPSPWRNFRRSHSVPRAWANTTPIHNTTPLPRFVHLASHAPLPPPPPPPPPCTHRLPSTLPTKLWMLLVRWL